MQVTSFYPMYGTQKIDEALKFFESLGFHERHKIKNDFMDIRVLKNDAGMHIDVMDTPIVRELGLDGFYGVRINAQNLQEAMELFEKNGAKAMCPVIDGGRSSELVYYKTKNGDIYCISHHKK